MTTKKRIVLLLKSKDVKTLAENFISLSLLQVVGYVFPLLTLPYLARVIGVDKFGEIAFAGAFMIYFKTLVDYGFNFTATRNIAINRDNLHKISEIFSSVLWARGLLMALSFAFLLILIFVVPIFYEMRILLLFSFCSIPGQILFPEWLFQGLERMRYITILNVLAKLIFTIAIFIFIRKKSDYIVQPLLIAMGFFISGLASMYIILVKYKIKLLKPSLLSIKETIKGSTDVFINQLFPNLYNSFSVLLLGFWGGAIANGILDAGSKFISISQQFLTVVSRTFFPYLSRNIQNHKIYTRLNLLFSISLSIMLFIFAPLIIHLFYTVEFDEAIKVLRILSISILFLAISDIYGTNYMIIKGHEKSLRNISMLSSIIGFIIAAPLIYYYSYTGAAITITIARGILGLSITYEAKKIKKINLN